MLRELRAGGIELPLTAEALEAAYPVRDFESFLGWFAVAHVLEGAGLDLYEHVIAAHVERLKAQGVVYAEIMVASGSLPTDPGEAAERMMRFRAWVDGLEGGEIQVELLIAFGRNRTLERAEAVATRIIRVFEEGAIAGVALAGPERGYPVAPLARCFDRFHAAGMSIEIHAAEWCGPESAWDALEHGHPNRLGHGTHVFDDERLVEVLLERRLHIEMCPTSNVLTGSIGRIDEHPIGRALERGLNVGVNNDDPGAFGCSMESEHVLLMDRFGFSNEDLRQLTLNALRARFKRELRGPAAAVAVS